MAHLFVLLFIALPLLRLILAIAWPGLLKRVESRSVARMLHAQFGDGQDDPRLTAISARLLADSGLSAHVQLLAGPLRNAVALPDGRIFIWEGLLEETGGDDDMLAGVLAHELGHLQHDHFLEQVQWVAMVRVILGLIGGSLLGHLLRGPAARVITSGFSRASELEADEAAVGLMQAAGYNPAGLVHLLEQLALHTQPGGLLGTHPEPRTRAARLRTRLGIEAPAPASAPEPVEGGTVIPFPGGR